MIRKFPSVLRFQWQALYINYGPAELLDWPVERRREHLGKLSLMLVDRSDLCTLQQSNISMGNPLWIELWMEKSPMNGGCSINSQNVMLSPFFVQKGPLCKVQMFCILCKVPRRAERLRLPMPSLSGRSHAWNGFREEKRLKSEWISLGLSGYIFEGSLEVKLPTIWRDEKAVSREKSQKRKDQKKEDAGARKGRKVTKHCVFSWFCGSGGLKSRLAKAAGAETSGEMRDEKLHAVVARSTFGSKMC